MGMFGWQEYAASDVRQVTRKVKETDCRSRRPSGSWTEWRDRLLRAARRCQPRAGDTVVVSTAAGAVGRDGGSDRKARRLPHGGHCGRRDQDGAVPRRVRLRRRDRLQGRQSGCGARGRVPRGIDVYFDNTAGPISDAVLRHLALGARVVICGTASVASWIHPDGPRVERHLLVKRARMQGSSSSTTSIATRKRSAVSPTGCAQESCATAKTSSTASSTPRVRSRASTAARTSASASSGCATTDGKRKAPLAQGLRTSDFREGG